MWIVVVKLILINFVGFHIPTKASAVLWKRAGKRAVTVPRVFLCGSCVLPNGRRHIIPASLHIGDQLELGAAAVQILPCPVDGKVMIALQIVGEKRIPHSSVVSLAPMADTPVPRA